jgi:hypothetical protein
MVWKITEPNITLFRTVPCRAVLVSEPQCTALVDVDFDGNDLPYMPLQGVFDNPLACALACVEHRGEFKKLAPRGCTHYTLTQWGQCYLKENAGGGIKVRAGSTSGVCKG